MKNIKDLVVAECKKNGITFKEAENFFNLSSKQVNLLNDFAKQMKYKRSKSNMSSKSTIHLFYDSLKRYNKKK